MAPVEQYKRRMFLFGLAGIALMITFALLDPLIGKWSFIAFALGVPNLLMFWVYMWRFEKAKKARRTPAR